MQINKNNIKRLAGSLADRLLIALEMGTLPIGGKGRHIIWEEVLLGELQYWIESEEPIESDVQDKEVNRIL